MSEMIAANSDTNSKTNETVSGFSKNITSFECKFCSKVFLKKHSLNRHKKVCSLNDSVKNTTSVECQVCGRPFNRPDNLKKHEKNCSASVTKNKQMKKRSCLYENCKANFYQKEALIQHLTNNHGHSFEERSQLSFLSYSDFEAWKGKMEEETHSCFIKINGKKGAVQYFYCQQDGEPDKAQRKTNRRNSKGPIKSGRTCIAFIKLIEKSEAQCYDVIFQPMHCHLLQRRDKKHHPIPIPTKDLNVINAELLVDSAPEQGAVCIENLSSDDVTEFSVSANHKHNSSAVVSGGVVFSCGLTEGSSQQNSPKIRKNSDDETSVINIVQNYLNEADSPIILYKSSNPEVYVGPEEFQDLSVPSDAFILGIQTKEQREMFVSGCQLLLSLDTSHMSEEEGYQVLNLVVPDENCHEYPVGHLIVNDLNASFIAIFFYSILSRCGDVTINCIISNNDPELNEAIHSVFGQNVRHIFCTWRLYQDFRKHLEMFASVELFDEMFTALEALIHSDDETTAQNMLQNFKDTYAEVAPNFIDFLWKGYADVIPKWVMHFRTFNHEGINTIMLSEANHNKLLSFMGRKLEWNLEDLVNLLLELEEDDYLRRANEQILGVSFGLSDPENSRHEEGLQISDISINYLFKNHWEVKSPKKMDKCYLVVRVRETCSAELCYNTCSQCDRLCGHLYYCTCIDKNPMCKHIHKVHLSLIHAIKVVNEEMETVIPADHLEVSPAVELEIEVPPEDNFPLCKGRACTDLKITEIKSCLNKFSNFLAEEDLSIAFLKHADKTLQELVNIGDALT